MTLGLNKMIERSTLAASVAQQLRAQIAAGQFGPGDYLPPQKDLAEQFGVGLSTIREAVQLLSAAGLVKSHPGKGTWISEEALNSLISTQAVKTRLGELNARQVHEARAVIEVALAGLAAGRATGADIERIAGAMEALRQADDLPSFIAADLEFHLSIARAGHNELLEQFYQLVQKLLIEMVDELIRLPHVVAESLPLQQAVLTAVEQKDTDGARQAAQTHMAYIAQLIEKYE